MRRDREIGPGSARKGEDPCAGRADRKVPRKRGGPGSGRLSGRQPPSLPKAMEAAHPADIRRRRALPVSAGQGRLLQKPASASSGPRLAPSRGEAGDLQEDRLPDGPGLCAPASERAGRGGPARARALPGAAGPGHALGRPPAHDSERLRAPVRQSYGGHSRPKRTHLTQQAAHCLQAFMNEGFSDEFGAKSSTGPQRAVFALFFEPVARRATGMARCATARFGLPGCDGRHRSSSPISLSPAWGFSVRLGSKASPLLIPPVRVCAGHPSGLP